MTKTGRAISSTVLNQVAEAPFIAVIAVGPYTRADTDIVPSADYVMVGARQVLPSRKRYGLVAIQIVEVSRSVFKMVDLA
jgi:hypothetical protein